jgi:biopolymer transport protein ExbB
MSIAVVALGIDYSINLRKEVLMPPPVVAQIGTMFTDRDYRGAMEYTENEPSILSYVIHASLVEAGGGYSAMERAMNEAIKERLALLMARVDICNIIGQLAPMVGLFGTVRAMIKAFGDMANPANAGMSPAQQAANGLRTAMVKTFWGLFIGTIGLAVYSAFRLQLVRLGNLLLHQAAEFVDTFKPGRQSARTQTATPQPQPARR